MFVSNLPSVLASRQEKRCMTEIETSHSSLRVVVLGSGTSMGVPVIGATYPEAFLANPKNHRTRPSILVETDRVRLLIDTTPEMRSVSQGRIGMVDAVLITHAHADHIMGMDDCRRFIGQLGGPFRLCQCPGHGGDSWSSYALTIHPFPPPTQTRPRIIDGPFTIEDIEITLVPLPLRAHANSWLHFSVEAPAAGLSHRPWKSPRSWSASRTSRSLDALRFDPHPTHMCYDEALTAARALVPARHGSPI